MKWCIDQKWDIVLLSEMNNNSDGIRLFRYKGQGRYLLYSNKTGILISKDVYCFRQANNGAWSPGGKLEMVPTSEEIMKEMEDSAPGEDGIRLGFIKKASKELQQAVVLKIKAMWNTSATVWEEPLKVGVTIPLFKKGDKNYPNNYRGICLLPILSRVLGRILATRVRVWAEEMNLLYENQA